MGQLARGIDTLIDYIISFTDYYIVGQNVTLSEGSLFAIAITRTFWVVIFGVNSENYEMLGGQLSWFTIYLILTVGHVTAFITRNTVARFAVCCGHAFIWCILSLIMLMVGSRSIQIPVQGVLMGLSVFIAVRLYRESKRILESNVKNVKNIKNVKKRA